MAGNKSGGERGTGVGVYHKVACDPPIVLFHPSLLNGLQVSAFNVPANHLGLKPRAHERSLPVTRQARTAVHAPAALQLTSEVTLYGNRNSRSPLIEWYLVEINKQYTHR